jgi:hypothetical protein
VGADVERLVAWFLRLLDSRAQPVGAEDMSTFPTPPKSKPKRRGRILLATAIGLTLLVAAGCVADSGRTDPGPDPTPPTSPSPDPPDDPAPRPDPPKEDPEPAPEDPAAVVRDYFAAINARDEVVPLAVELRRRSNT